MDFPAADRVTISLPAFFRCRPRCTVRVVFGHPDRIFVAKKVGRMQQVNVQGVALNPFAAIEQPAEGAELPSTFTPNASSIA